MESARVALTNTQTVLLEVLYKYLVIEGPGKCFGGRLIGCTWMQISHFTTEFIRRKWPRCMEADCDGQPGTHKCRGGRLICCKHAFRFQYYHETWNNARECVCRFTKQYPQGCSAAELDRDRDDPYYFSFDPICTIQPNPSLEQTVASFSMCIINGGGDEMLEVEFPRWLKSVDYESGNAVGISDAQAIEKMHFMVWFSAQVDRRILYQRMLHRSHLPAHLRVPLVQYVTGRYVDMREERKEETTSYRTYDGCSSEDEMDYLTYLAENEN